MKFSVNRTHLLEFFLVFAAVALGFIAENVREHYSDKAREKEFIRSLIGNLRADSIIYAKRDSALRERVVWMDTLISLVTGNQINRNAETYLLARYSTRVIQAKPGSSTLNFLSRSNEYMLIDDHKVKDQIQQYETRLIWLRSLTDGEEEGARTLWQLIPLVFDTKVFVKMRLSNVRGTSRYNMPMGNPSLLSRDPIALNQLAYMLYLRRTQFASELVNDLLIEKECKSLIKFLEKKYGLE